MLFGDGANGDKFANTGVGENNIDSSLHLGDGLVKTVKVGQVGNISLNARNVAAESLYGVVEFLLATARNEDIRTLFDEKICRSQPNPFGTTRDESDLVFKLVGHISSPLTCLGGPAMTLCSSLYCPVSGLMLMRPFGRIRFHSCYDSIAEELGLHDTAYWGSSHFRMFETVSSKNVL